MNLHLTNQLHQEKELPEPLPIWLIPFLLCFALIVLLGVLCLLFCKKYWRWIFIGVAVIGFLVAVQLSANN